MSLVKFKPLGDEAYDYPDWADAVGWCLGCLSMAQIPLWAIVNIFQQKGSSLKDVSIYLATSDSGSSECPVEVSGLSHRIGL
jgi:hypothetical protein